MEIEENAGTPSRFIVIRQEVLYDKNLSLVEKIVYARICAFEEYFESAEACAEMLGLSKRQVEEAKRKLEKCGYIECVANTGRGKRFCVRYDLRKNVGQTYENLYIRPTDFCNSDLRNSVDIDKRLEKTIEQNENINDANASLAETATYGNPSINEMFDKWEDEFGFKQKASAENRRACWNLLRRNDVGEEKLGKIIKVLGEAQNDKFAPKEIRSIIGFASLQKNLPHLVIWARRKYSQNQRQEDIEI